MILQYIKGTVSHSSTQDMMVEEKGEDHDSTVYQGDHLTQIHTRYGGLNVRGRNGLAYAQCRGRGKKGVGQQKSWGGGKWVRSVKVLVLIVL